MEKLLKNFCTKIPLTSGTIIDIISKDYLDESGFEVKDIIVSPLTQIIGLKKPYKQANVTHIAY